MGRTLYGHEAVKEALDISLQRDERVFLIGQGVPDGSQTYGTTSGLYEKFGPERVFEMPLAEAAMVGAMVGAAIVGSRPVMTFARVEFALLAMDAIVNQAAKWSYMFDGVANVPLTLRLIVGRGWGQGAQHSQSLQALFAHIPGLKVVMPSTPHDLKGLLIASIEDPNPVIILEHRWLHYNFGEVPEGYYNVPLGLPHVMCEGGDVTVVSSSYMTFEAAKAASILRSEGIKVDLIDLRTIAPLNHEMILDSVKKTGRLVVCDHATYTGGISAEIVSRVVENSIGALKSSPVRVTLPDVPISTTRALANYCYPTVAHITNAVKKTLGLEGLSDPFESIAATDLLDIPDSSFKGPF